MLSQTQPTCNQTAINADIDALAHSLAALHDMARSFPVGITLPVEKRAEFDTLFDTVTAQFEHVACSLEAAGIPVEAVLC